MADKNRYKCEIGNVEAAVDSAQTVDVGDCVYQVTDDARPADQVTYAGLASTQEAFRDGFIGVSMDRSRNGDTDPIRIKTQGEFEFDCAAATFELGDFVGMDDNAGGTALENQKVIAVTDAARAIGVVAKRYSSNTTTVRVWLISQVMAGGLQRDIASA